MKKQKDEQSDEDPKKKTKKYEMEKVKGIKEEEVVSSRTTRRRCSPDNDGKGKNKRKNSLNVHTEEKGKKTKHIDDDDTSDDDDKTKKKTGSSPEDKKRYLKTRTKKKVDYFSEDEENEGDKNKSNKNKKDESVSDEQCKKSKRKMKTRKKKDDSSSDEEIDNDKKQDCFSEDEENEGDKNKSNKNKKKDESVSDEQCKKSKRKIKTRKKKDDSSSDEENDNDKKHEVSKKKKKIQHETSSDEDDEKNVKIVASSPEINTSKSKRNRNIKKAESSEDESIQKRKNKKKLDSDFEVVDISDDSDVKPVRRRKTRSMKKSKSSSEENSSSELEKPKPKRRKRIVKIDSSGDNSEDDKVNKGRKDIRKVIKDKNLSDTTRQAAKEEEERKKRVSDLQKLYNVVTEGVDTHGYKITTKLVLEQEEDEEVVVVHPKIIKKLKPHQVEGVKFMWGSTIESTKRSKDHEGSGCILAHCMGLGKTLQVISFVHTVMNSEIVGLNRVLVVCPVNTILNWVSEFDYWLEGKLKLEVFELSSVKNNWQRATKLNTWHEDGGVMIMGYDMFRTLTQEKGKKISKRQREIFATTLIDPGPDLVVCDEGHILKNGDTALSKAMNRIKSRRRIVLTGTPLQNNLSEYHCMVSFVKPNLLGTSKEFKNRFVNPISNGQCADSTQYDFKMMKRRAHILHNLLDGCVQRRDYSVLTPFLPPKNEYVISIKLSEVQIKLYQEFLDKYARGKSTLRSGLFADYQNLMKIWTHPWVLRLAEIRDDNKAINDNTDDSFIDDSTPDTSDSEDVSSGSEKKKKGKGPKKHSSDEEDEVGSADEVVKDWKSSTRRGRGEAGDDEGAGPSREEPVIEPAASRGWWTEHVKEEDATNLELSGKLILLFDILQSCMDIGDKVLVFSQSLLSLDLIEDMLERMESKEKESALLNESVEEEKTKNTWRCGEDYFRMDGSTAVETRKRQCEAFNDDDNYRARLFLISTRAGGLGINLVAANRVIVFDASWNPTHDVQSIFRVYRFGQKKPVYIYRFLAQGTMEEKIYERQVTKQSLACRVVDEQQIERHFNAADLLELYNFEPESSSKKATPIVPKDRLLAELLIRRKEWIVGYHEHDSLLENKESEILSEEERKAAWEEYENEKKGLIRAANAAIGGIGNMNYQMQAHANNPVLPNIDVQRIIGIIQQQNPGLTPEMLVAKVQNTIIQLRSQQRWVGLQAIQLRQQGAEMDRVVKLEQQVQSYTFLIVSLERWLQGMMGRPVFDFSRMGEV